MQASARLGSVVSHVKAREIAQYYILRVHYSRNVMYACELQLLLRNRISKHYSALSLWINTS